MRPEDAIAYVRSNLPYSQYSFDNFSRSIGGEVLSAEQISELDEALRSAPVMFHVADPSYKKGQDLLSLAEQINQGKVSARRAIKYIMQKWPDYAWSEDKAEEYINTEGAQIHGYYTFQDATEHANEFCPDCKILQIDLSGLDVDVGEEFLHPVVRERIPASRIREVAVIR